jgi:signal transduction histidine kinase
VVQRLRALLRKGEPERKLLDINQLVTGVTTLIRHDLERAQVSLRLALGEALPHVPGDPVQLQQVILNLLLNACDAMSVVQSGLRTLDVATDHDGQGLVIVTVRDSGVGVSESELTGIFEPFVTTKPQGLGMGLAISRSIVEAHKGRIWATRNDDHGLTVHIELPISAT